MVYKYLLVRLILQIYSSEWVLFTMLIFFCFFLKKKLCGPFLWMGFNYFKATEPLRGGTLLFATKLPSILSFPENLLPTIFQFSRIDSKFWCDGLHDLVSFVQFKKREKHLWRSVTFGLLKVTLLHGCFHVLKIVQMVPSCAKHHLVDCALSIDGSKRGWSMHLHKIYFPYLE